MSYSMQPARTPRLRGRALRALVALLENPASRSLIAPRILKDTGIGTLRAANLNEAPTLHPRLAEPTAVTDTSSAGDVDPETRELTGEVGGFATAGDFARCYREGSITPEEVADRVLDAIRRGDNQEPPLHLMIAVQREDLLRQARASTDRFRRGNPLGPLDGVPVAVKDELDQVPYPTTVGTRFLREVASEDAFVVARLRAAGAVLIGKANMHEVGIDTTGFNPWHGTPRNPYDTTRYTGGSSSGPAAAVAAGLCPIAVGADGGGSIRIPAALCGVFGLKPTFGRVSERGVAPLAWSVAHVGPIAASAHDLAIGYAGVAGPDPRDPNTLRQPPPRLPGGGDGIGGLRIGIFGPWFEDAAEDVVRACRELLARFESAGATMVEVEIPDLELCRLAHGVTILSEMATALARYDADHRRDFSLGTRLNLALARELSGRDYVRAQQVRTRMIVHFERAFETVDVIATPTCARTAPPIRPDVLPLGESDLEVTSSLMRFVLPPNLTGHPAVSVPAGFGDEGLPVGLQLIGRAWDEARLLRLAEVAESMVARRPPAAHFDLLAGAGLRARGAPGTHPP